MEIKKILVICGYIGGKPKEASLLVDTEDDVKKAKKESEKLGFDNEPCIFLVDFDKRSIIWK